MWARVRFRHLCDRVENNLFRSLFLHLPCFYKLPPLIRENFPPYPFLGGLLPLAPLQQEGVPTCASDLEKNKFPSPIRAALGAGHWVSLTPVIWLRALTSASLQP